MAQTVIKDEQVQEVISAILHSKKRIDEAVADKSELQDMQAQVRQADQKWVDADNKLRAAEAAESRAKNLSIETARKHEELLERERNVSARETEHERRLAAHAALAADLDHRQSVISKLEASLQKREAGVLANERDYRERIAALKRIVG